MFIYRSRDVVQLNKKIQGKMISFVCVMDNFVPFYGLQYNIYLREKVVGGVSAKGHYSLWPL